LGHLLPEYFFSGRGMDSQDYVHIEKAGEKQGKTGEQIREILFKTFMII